MIKIDNTRHIDDYTLNKLSNINDEAIEILKSKQEKIFYKKLLETKERISNAYKNDEMKDEHVIMDILRNIKYSIEDYLENN